MSKGIGKAWFEKNQRDVFPSDFVVHDGKKLAVPRFYGDLYELNFPHAMLPIKRARMKKNGDPLLLKDDAKDRRLRVREDVTKVRVKWLKKELDQ